MPELWRQHKVHQLTTIAWQTKKLIYTFSKCHREKRLGHTGKLKQRFSKRQVCSFSFHYMDHYVVKCASRDSIIAIPNVSGEDKYGCRRFGNSWSDWSSHWCWYQLRGSPHCHPPGIHVHFFMLAWCFFLFVCLLHANLLPFIVWPMKL